MLLDYIGRYYHYLWLLLTVLALLKIILSYSFQENLEGLNGLFYALFKWYGEEEQELEDYRSRRTIMRLHNMVTLGIYGTIAIMIVAYFIRQIFSR